MKIDENKIAELTELSKLAIEEEVEKIKGGDIVGVKFIRLSANLHATKEVNDAIIHLIRFGEERRNFSPYQVGQSLQNEEAEKEQLFFQFFNQPLVFIPDETYRLPLEEVMEYKKKLGKYKETYLDGPMFFKTVEEYERALDTKDYVVILEE